MVGRKGWSQRGAPEKQGFSKHNQRPKNTKCQSTLTFVRCCELTTRLASPHRAFCMASPAWSPPATSHGGEATPRRSTPCSSTQGHRLPLALGAQPTHHTPQ